jgi:hypothetical protein
MGGVMSMERRYLIIRADRSVRCVTRMPRLAMDEIAVPLRLNFPETWGRVRPEAIVIDVPEFEPNITADVSATVQPEPEELMGT